MSRKVLKKSFLDEKEGEEDENEIRRKDVPWSNPNKLQATDRITHTTQGPGTSGSRRVVHVSSARHPDTRLGAETLRRPGRRHPVFIEETRPGAVVVPGIDSDGLTVEEVYDEQATIASYDHQSTVQIIARAVDTEAEERNRREQDQIRRERDQILREQDQLRHERDQLRQILDSAPIVTPFVAPNRDVEKGEENIHVNHDDSPRSDDPKCGPRGRRWFAMSAILLIVVVIIVTLVVVLPSEPTPSDPTPSDPTTTAPTAEPTTPPNPLSELLSSTRSDELSLDFSEMGLNGTIPTEIGEFTKLTSLDLGHNTLTGTIPSEIELLTNLASLYLGFNYLTGTIPTEMGLLTNLNFLSFWTNALAGTIPSELGLLTNLDYLDLGDDELTGSIQTEIGLLTDLAFLSFWDNKLTGNIPSELGLLTKLTRLDLSRNGFTGTVPTSLASVPYLYEMYLHSNDLTGSLDAFCGIGIGWFVANTCGQDEIICTCCTHCWNSASDSFDPV